MLNTLSVLVLGNTRTQNPPVFRDLRFAWVWVILHNEAEEVAYDQNPIGAGPLELTRHVQAEVMEFERFEDFYYQPKNGLPEDRRVKVKSCTLRLVPEEATRVAAIRAGEADIAPASPATKGAGGSWGRAPDLRSRGRLRASEARWLLRRPQFPLP